MSSGSLAAIAALGGGLGGGYSLKELVGLLVRLAERSARPPVQPAECLCVCPSVGCEPAPQCLEAVVGTAEDLVAALAPWRTLRVAIVEVAASNDYRLELGLMAVALTGVLLWVLSRCLLRWSCGSPPPRRQMRAVRRRVGPGVPVTDSRYNRRFPDPVSS